MLPTKFWFIWPCSFFGEDLKKNRLIRNKNCLWWPCLLTDREDMSNLWPSIDASYQVSVHLAKRFRRRRFLKIGQSETRIACGGHVCLWIKTKWANLYKGPSIYASCQDSVHLTEGFHRRRLKYEKLADDGRRTPSDGKSSRCLWQGELNIRNITFHTKK